jgi:hypothetical protein
LKIIGFDFDGVIASLPIRSHFVLKFIWYLYTIPFIRRIYIFYVQKLNKEVLSFMGYLKEKKVKIYIITGNRKSYKKEIKEWLNKNKVPYDRLFCYSSSLRIKVEDWKISIVKKYKISYLIDDNFYIVKKLKERGILYRDQSFDELKRLTNIG